MAPAESAPEPVSAAPVRAAFAAVGVELPRLAALSAKRPHLIGHRVRSEEAVAAWERLRALTDRTGFYPLIFRDEHGMLTGEDGPDFRPPAETLAAAAAIDPEAWLRAREEEEAEYEPLPRGEGAAEPVTRFAVPFDIATGRPVEDLWLLLLPTRHGHEVPSYIGFGDWNACPAPEVHVAMLRRWHERWGAEIVTMSGDTIELRTPRRPATQDEAVALAFEQSRYCEDIVTQGVGTVDALAASLMKSDVWFFWWD